MTTKVANVANVANVATGDGPFWQHHKKKKIATGDGPFWQHHKREKITKDNKHQQQKHNFLAYKNKKKLLKMKKYKWDENKIMLWGKHNNKQKTKLNRRNLLWRELQEMI